MFRAKKWGSNQDAFFGDARSRSRLISQGEANAEGFEDGWRENDSEDGFIDTESKEYENARSAQPGWGFKDVEGVRRHTRQVKIINEAGERNQVRMISDFVGGD